LNRYLCVAQNLGIRGDHDDLAARLPIHAGSDPRCCNRDNAHPKAQAQPAAPGDQLHWSREGDRRARAVAEYDAVTHAHGCGRMRQDTPGGASRREGSPRCSDGCLWNSARYLSWPQSRSCATMKSRDFGACLSVPWCLALVVPGKDSGGWLGRGRRRGRRSNESRTDYQRQRSLRRPDSQLLQEPTDPRFCSAFGRNPRIR